MLSGVRPPELCCFDLVVPREVGTDHAPASSAVLRHVHELAARVDRVVVVRRDRERRVPHEAILDVGRGMPARAQRPHLDVLSRARALVEADDDAAAAPGAGRRRPDDVRVDGIGRRPPALAALARACHSLREIVRAGSAVARPAIRRTVLLVAVDVVRNSVVDGDVIDLRDRAACTCSQVRPRVVEMCTPASFADDHADRVRRIDPHVVVVAAGRGERRRRRRAAAAVGRRRRAPGRAPPPPPPRPFAVSVAPPSIEWLNVAQRKYVSSGLSGATAMRV